MTFEREELEALIAGFTSKLDEYKAALDDLKSSIYTDFIEPAEKNYHDWDHSTRLEEFREKYPDLEALKSDCALIERDDDFDVVDKVFTDYDEGDKSIEEAEYVSNVVASLTSQINDLKEKLGAEKVEIKADDDSVEVEADGQDVAESEEVKENTEILEEEKEDDIDSIDREIEEGLAKYDNRKIKI